MLLAAAKVDADRLDHAQLGREANALNVVREERASARGGTSIARTVAALGALRLTADVRDERGRDAAGRRIAV